MIRTTLVIIACLVASSPVWAYDGSRHGLFAGLGLGVAGVSYTDRVSSGSTTLGYASGSQAGLLFDGRFGKGFTEQTLVYFDLQSLWFRMEVTPSVHKLIDNGVIGVGVMYSLSPRWPSPMLKGGVGLSYWGTWNASGKFHSVANRWGAGAFVGAGYEFSPSWMLEATIAFGNASKTAKGVRGKANSTIFGICLTTQGYNC